MEPTPTPWRVFDAPPDGVAATATAPTPGERVRIYPQLVAVAGLIAALAVTVLAVVIALASSGAEVVEGPPAGPVTGEVSASGRSAGEIVVDVAGAVTTPGIYHLAAGSRVGDAIEAAGGFSPRVDVERVGAEINLAATLSDGARVRVPSRDEPGASSGSARPAGGNLVNLNSATEAELDALTGIGPVTAGKIIESRAAAPFRTVDELRERGLVGEKTFEKIKAQLTVG